MFDLTLAIIPHDLGMDLAFCAALTALMAAVVAGFLDNMKNEDGMCA